MENFKSNWLVLILAAKIVLVKFSSNSHFAARSGSGK